jgi:hypothetical protein
MELFDKCGSQQLELQYGHQQISATHLAGNFLLQSQTKPVFVKYTMSPTR